MITCPDCHASVKDEHVECPVCGGLLHLSEEQRAIAKVAQDERNHAAARAAGDAIREKDIRDGSGRGSSIDPRGAGIDGVLDAVSDILGGT